MLCVFFPKYKQVQQFVPETFYKIKGGYSGPLNPA